MSKRGIDEINHFKLKLAGHARYNKLTSLTKIGEKEEALVDGVVCPQKEGNSTKSSGSEEKRGQNGHGQGKENVTPKNKQTKKPKQHHKQTKPKPNKQNPKPTPKKQKKREESKGMFVKGKYSQIFSSGGQLLVKNDDFPHYNPYHLTDATSDKVKKIVGSLEVPKPTQPSQPSQPSQDKLQTTPTISKAAFSSTPTPKTSIPLSNPKVTNLLQDIIQALDTSLQMAHYHKAINHKSAQITKHALQESEIIFETINRFSL
eukprot:TRINITY_DN12184_c0_g1_i1.p1 TRINITY_DN12184_c0_g1~~TRINITY_DN12184_c0_g1_i1.p1  ORF type:complete len:260 (+),score=82.04 TRINITY_DN12184_c0_g1_i1:97-876(+)